MKNLKIVFYLLTTLTFFIFLYIRYNNVLNGYLLIVPLVLSIILLIAISALAILRIKEIKSMIKEWIFFGSLTILAILVVKFI